MNFVIHTINCHYYPLHSVLDSCFSFGLPIGLFGILHIPCTSFVHNVLRTDPRIPDRVLPLGTCRADDCVMWQAS